MLLPEDSRDLALERARRFLEGGAKAAVVMDVGRRSVDIHRPRGVDAYGNQKEVRVVELGYFTIETPKIFS
jgi:hypothetical protein